MVVLRSRVTEVGQEAPALIAGGFLILFGPQAPPELRAVSVIHRVELLAGELAAGQELRVGGTSYRITAVGPLANRNLQALGHLVVKFNGRDEPELPGDVCVEAGPAPAPVPGTLIEVTAACGAAGRTGSGAGDAGEAAGRGSPPGKGAP